MIPLFFVPWIPKKTLHLHWSPEPPQNIPRGGECLRIFRLRTANLSHLDDVGPWDSPKIPKLDGKNGVTVPKGYDFFWVRWNNYILQFIEILSCYTVILSCNGDILGYNRENHYFIKSRKDGTLQLLSRWLYIFQMVNPPFGKSTGNVFV